MVDGCTSNETSKLVLRQSRMWKKRRRDWAHDFEHRLVEAEFPLTVPHDVLCLLAEYCSKRLFRVQIGDIVECCRSEDTGVLVHWGKVIGRRKNGSFVVNVVSPWSHHFYGYHNVVVERVIRAKMLKPLGSPRLTTIYCRKYLYECSLMSTYPWTEQRWVFVKLLQDQYSSINHRFFIAKLSKKKWICRSCKYINDWEDWQANILLRFICLGCGEHYQWIIPNMDGCIYKLNQISNKLNTIQHKHKHCTRVFERLKTEKEIAKGNVLKLFEKQGFEDVDSFHEEWQRLENLQSSRRTRYWKKRHKRIMW